MSLIYTILFAGLALAQTCPVHFDGRIKANASLKNFDDSKLSPYGTGFVRTKTSNFSEIIEFNKIPVASLFESVVTKPFTMTINDTSIFAPSETNVQVGFRRVELSPGPNNGTDPSTLGVKTLHFSIMADVTRPLNYSHEYQLVFIESADFSTNQFVLKTGTFLDGPITADPKTLVLVGNVNDKPIKTLFTMPFTDGVWHNFALTLNFTALTTEVFYSQNVTPLKLVVPATANNISGQGQYHIGMLKKPTGTGLKDVTKEGFQETGISEALNYGGIFIEESGDGCQSLGLGV